MSGKFKVAMIGAGGRANQVIYPAFASLPDVEIAAICDIDPIRLSQTADMYSVTMRYGKDVFDYQNMISDVKPDAVIAIGQPNIFYDIWQWTLKNGYNLMIEKPFGLSAHQARSLTWLAGQMNLTTQVSFQRRITPMVVKLRDECLKRGPIVHAVCEFYKSMITPYIDARDHMMDDCVHAIDTLRWICGGEVVKIDSYVKRVMTPDINFISATLHFDNGATGFLINSWSSGKRIFSVEMHAPNIYVEAEHEGKAYVYTDGNLEPQVYDTAEVAESEEFHVFTGVQAKARAFVDACKTGGQPDSCFEDALKTMLIAEKILAQGLLSEVDM